MAMARRDSYLLMEVLVRCVLGIAFLILEKMEPFRRHISREELWLYKNPRTPSYVSTSLLWMTIVLIPVGAILLINMLTRQKSDIIQAMLGFSLSLEINGIITNIIKLLVGRPRPDFFWRCFPDGRSNDEMLCTGNYSEIIEGLKSFPSGHASFSWVSMGYLFCYLAGKLEVFTAKGRGQAWRLVMSITPLLLSLAIAISRTCDYHHHWQDVTVGSLIGLSVGHLCYRQYYPGLSHPHCALPYSSVLMEDLTQTVERDKELQLTSVKLI